jgi:hypothetical protein
LERIIKTWWFERTLPSKIDAAVADWHTSQPPTIAAPTIREHPVDTELQTGEAAKLGGPMSIHAPWRRD